MHFIIKIIIISILFIICDIPWLLFNKSWFVPMMSAIQGSKVSMILWPTLIIYPAMSFLLLQSTSILHAATIGAATYAVYDFTNLATIKDYQLSFAIADTVWGGILFSIVKVITSYIF